MKVGEGKVPTTEGFCIELPKCVNVVHSSKELVETVFGDLENKSNDIQWLTSRAILAPTNSRLPELNGKVAERLPWQFRTYKTVDSVLCDYPDAQGTAQLRYLQELLNSIDTGSPLPDHELKLKRGFVVMLFRNIKPSRGHVNGIRYILDRMTSSLLFLTAVSGTHKGNRLILPRMICCVGITTSLFPVSGDVSFRFESASP